MSGDRWRTLRGVVAATALVCLAGVTEARAQSATADIQWAQTILKEKGFDIGGRANGQMTAQTRAALSAYQKSVGLPATGQLDAATTARMMGDREKKAAPTMGSLSKSQIGQSPREKEVAPAPRRPTGWTAATRRSAAWRNSVRLRPPRPAAGAAVRRALPNRKDPSPKPR